MKRLDILDEYFGEFEANIIDSNIVYQKKFTEPKRIEIGYPVSPNSESKNMITVNWLLNEAPMSAKDQLAFGILDYLLLGTSSSSLRKVLTESQLGESVNG